MNKKDPKPVTEWEVVAVDSYSDFCSKLASMHSANPNARSLQRSTPFIRNHYPKAYELLKGYEGTVYGTYIFEVQAGQEHGKRDIWYYPKSGDTAHMEQWIEQAQRAGIIAPSGRLDVDELLRQVRTWWANLETYKKLFGGFVVVILPILTALSHSINIYRFFVGR